MIIRVFEVQLKSKMLQNLRHSLLLLIHVRFLFDDDFRSCFFFLVEKGDYNVITTNYVDYALVYACQNIPIIDRKVEFIWILS